MHRRLIGLLPLLLLAGLALGAAGYLRTVPSVGRLMRSEASMAEREQRAKAHFLREHPGEQPLNHEIGQAALRLYRERPMGRFVLGIGWDDKGNDCSDFVNCVVDEGVGVGGRLERGSKDHLIGDSMWYFDEFPWDHQSPLLPGDIITIRHSPWYDPYPGACWHVGILGSDGMVYDFVKLKRWKEARYGKNKVEWFVRHAQGANEVYVRRLLPEYRYRVARLPFTEK